MPFRHRSSPTNRARRNREKDEETEEIEIEDGVDTQSKCFEQ